jgi:parallel beta-helix repeat protein
MSLKTKAFRQISGEQQMWVTTRGRGKARVGFLAIAAVLMSAGGVALAGGASAAPATLIVDDDLACPGATFSTISDAIAAAQDGDTIQVCAGFYQESLSTGSKNLTLVGPQANVSPPDFPTPAGEAVIDGGGSANPVVELLSNSTLNGFTVQGGERGVIGDSGTSIRSSSFRSLDTALQVFSNVVVSDNVISANSVGILLDFASGTTVSGNLFRGTFSTDAIDLPGGDPDDDPIMNVSVVGNTYAPPAGGGSFLEAAHTVGLKVSGNTVTGGEDSIELDPSDHDWTVSGNRFSNVSNDAVVIGCIFGAGDTAGAGSITQNLFSNVDTAVRWSNGGGSCAGTFELHSNVFPAGDGTSSPDNAAVYNASDATVNAENNFWGCNFGPRQPGCASVVNVSGANRYLVLLSAIGTKTLAVGQSTPFTADLNHNNLGETVPLPVLDGTPIFFSSSTYLSVTPAVGVFANGVATAVVKAKQPPGTAGIGGQSVSGALENATTTQSGITIKGSTPPPPPPPALPALVVHDASTTEGLSGSHVMYFSVTLSKKYTKAVTVKFATGNGTAKAPADYLATAGTLTFPAGVTSKAIAVTVKGDKIKESNETFVVTIYGPVNAKIADPNALGVIRNS